MLPAEGLTGTVRTTAADKRKNSEERYRPVDIERPRTTSFFVQV